jgi:hypothetical protein
MRTKEKWVRSLRDTEKLLDEEEGGKWISEDGESVGFLG